MFDDKVLWKERATKRSKDMGRYLRYIFNGHLVVVLFFILGTGAFYYQEWVKGISADFPAILIMAFCTALLLTISPLYTFLLDADKIFLLPLETRLKNYFFRSGLVSFALQSYLVLMLVALFMPLYAAVSGKGFSQFWGFVFVLFVLKAWNIALEWKMQRYHNKTFHLYDRVIRYSLNSAFAYFLFVSADWYYIAALSLLLLFLYFYFSKQADQKGLKWESLVEQEERRMMAFYRFANLFTDVPKLKDKVKRRRWLDFVLNWLPFSQKKTYLHLFVTAFLRAGDYFGLFVRLSIIGMIALVLVSSMYGQLFVAIVFLYLTGFQLLPLWLHFQNKIWLDLYPLNAESKVNSFQKLLITIMLSQTFLFVVTLLIKGEILAASVTTVAGSLFSYFFVYYYNKKRLVP